MAFYQMGPETLRISMDMFKENRTKVCNELQSKISAKSLILLEGGSDISWYDTDVDHVFKQESFFMYMFGVIEPGFYGIVDVDSKRSCLFMPRLPEEYAVWMGKLYTPDDFKAKYAVDEVYYVDEMKNVITQKAPSEIHVLHGKNSDSGLDAKPASFDGIDQFTVKKEVLLPIISECRVIKSAKEIEVLRYVAKVSSDAHKKVMKTIKPGMMEYEAEAEFLSHCYGKGGCRFTSYTCICGVGTNSAILHYGHAAAPNDKMVRNGEMCLFDMGANYGGYAADITCSFPANGKFSDDQKMVYNAVLAARDAVVEKAREGVSWLDMHLLANRVMLQKLKEGGLLKGNVEEMMSAGLNGVFQPHGLGHLIGLDVHDVGSYLPGQPGRPTELGCTKLRFARTLKSGMYITIEPGCYFIDILLDRAVEDPKLNCFIDLEALKRFRQFGGVRIEENVVIRDFGVEVFSIVPRTVEEIEAFMAAA